MPKKKKLKCQNRVIQPFSPGKSSFCTEWAGFLLPANRKLKAKEFPKEILGSWVEGYISARVCRDEGSQCPGWHEKPPSL